MDFEKLVSPFANYLTFCLGFWQNNGEIYSEYLNVNEVSAKAVLLSFVGIGLYLIIRYAKTGIVPHDPNAKPQPGPKLDANTLILFGFSGLLTPVLLEISFSILGTRKLADIGPVSSTFNASFLSIALLMPLSGVSGRLSSIHLALKSIGGRTATAAQALNFFLSLLMLWMCWLCFDPFVKLHQTTWLVMWKPMALSLIIFVAAALPYLLFLYKWNQHLSLVEKSAK